MHEKFWFDKLATNESDPLTLRLLKGLTQHWPPKRKFSCKVVEQWDGIDTSHLSPLPQGKRRLIVKTRSTRCEQASY